MRFYKSRSVRHAVPPANAVFPCFVLAPDNWDDFGYRTLFHLHYFKRADSSAKLGDIKILEEGAKATNLPSSFPSLDAEFVSLGQDLEYYRSVRDHLRSKHRMALERRNDVVVKPQLLEDVEATTGSRNSLIRFNEAQISLRQGQAVLTGLDPNMLRKGHAFLYSGQIQSASAPVVARMDLSPDDDVPGRVLAIIGRNGVGKTQFLARLALDLAATHQTSEDSAAEIVPEQRGEPPQAEYGAAPLEVGSVSGIDCPSSVLGRVPVALGARPGRLGFSRAPRPLLSQRGDLDAEVAWPTA